MHSLLLFTVPFLPYTASALCVGDLCPFGNAEVVVVPFALADAGALAGPMIRPGYTPGIAIVADLSYLLPIGGALTHTPKRITIALKEALGSVGQSCVVAILIGSTGGCHNPALTGAWNDAAWDSLCLAWSYIVFGQNSGIRFADITGQSTAWTGLSPTGFTSIIETVYVGAYIYADPSAGTCTNVGTLVKGINLTYYGETEFVE